LHIISRGYTNHEYSQFLLPIDARGIKSTSKVSTKEDWEMRFESVRIMTNERAI
jgi:hypothetical protein